MVLLNTQETIMKSAECIVYLSCIYRVSIVYLSYIYRVCVLKVHITSVL